MLERPKLLPKCCMSQRCFWQDILAFPCRSWLMMTLHETIPIHLTDLSVNITKVMEIGSAPVVSSSFSQWLTNAFRDIYLKRHTTDFIFLLERCDCSSKFERLKKKDEPRVLFTCGDRQTEFPSIREVEVQAEAAVYCSRRTERLQSEILSEINYSKPIDTSSSPVSRGTERTPLLLGAPVHSRNG